MTRRDELDPLDELRRTDPASGDRVSPASLARIRARVQENIVLEREQSSPSGAPPRRRWLFGLGAGVAVAAIALALVFGRGASTPGLVPGGSDGPAVGSCVEQYSLETLAGREWAFDGTVTSTSGDSVTFTVNDLFKGSFGTSVTLEAPGMAGTTISSAGGPTVTVGERYLVAGDDTFVWGCGFTQPYDPVVVAAWADALGS